jgi:murein DD-endopeptidase MepM/ murein hydrolase activator NlpD
MKKLFFGKSNSDSQGKIVRFLEKRGFYIVLLLCLIIIGVTAVVVTQTNLEYFSDIGIINKQAVNENSKEESQKDVPVVAQQPIIVQKPVKSSESEQAKEQQVQQPEVEPVKTKPVEKTKPDHKAESAEKPAKLQNADVVNKMVIPLQGEIIVDYAKEHMVYSKTLGDWRTHEGIDIKGALGSQVKAAADGIVEKIYKDDIYGITIIIDHGNGLKSKYCNLSADDMVKEKQAVKLGDIISGVGDTAIFEIGEEPHLHFEVIKDEKSVDPKTFFSDSNIMQT